MPFDALRRANCHGASPEMVSHLASIDTPPATATMSLDDWVSRDTVDPEVRAHIYSLVTAVSILQKLTETLL